MSIAENIAQVRERVDAAARRAGRPPESITLMGVSKTFPALAVREAYAAGLRVFGENRVQEFADKAGELRGLANAEWHLIGHLQSNKANKAAELFSAVDSVDSLRLAEKLNSAAEKLGHRMPVLIEVNIGDEARSETLVQCAPVTKRVPDVLDGRVDQYLLVDRSHLRSPIVGLGGGSRVSAAASAVLDIRARLREFVAC